MTLITGWAPAKGAFCKALAPNVIHSLDAAHLALTVREARARGVRSFAAVHDCVGTHAGKVEVLRDCLRIVFASDEFAGAAQKMLDDFAELSGKKRPPRGDLDLSGVLRSDYFFD
jgi:DNA-directed RNA polymerase